jgi:hypothetical protein
MQLFYDKKIVHICTFLIDNLSFVLKKVTRATRFDGTFLLVLLLVLVHHDYDAWPGGAAAGQLWRRSKRSRGSSAAHPGAPPPGAAQHWTA